jgi:hypothetical protein
MGKGSVVSYQLSAKESNMSNDPNQINVEFPKEMVGGVYANNMAVTHTAEEFIMDYIMVAPPAGVVKSRIVVSPGHLKRIIRALQENLEKYEQKFGPIQIAEEPGGEVTIQ